MKNLSQVAIAIALILYVSPLRTYCQSNHTITLDGTNDFTSANESLGAEAGRTGYLTWDATNLYVGVEGNPIVNTSSNLYVVIDSDPAVNADSRSGNGRSDQPTVESGGATYPVNADVVYQFFGSGGDDASAQNPAPGNKYTVSAGSWSSVSIPTGVRIIRKTSSITELEFPFSDFGVSSNADFNIIIYVANSAGGGSNFAQWPTGNVNGNNPLLKDFYTETRKSSVTPNASTHYSYREHSTSGYAIGGSTFGSIFFVPGSATTYTQGSLTTLGYNLYIGPNATFSFGSSTSLLTASGSVGIAGTLTLSSAVGGDLNLSGNWTNSGTFTPSSRAVGFNGSSAQTITGATTFDYLTINNSTGVSLNNNATVNNTLTLTSGKLTLGANNLTIASSGSISGPPAIGTGTSNYIVTDGAGVLTRNIVGATNTLFPVGTATTYNPVQINNAGTADNFSVSVKGSFDNAPNDPMTCLTRQWTITEAVAGGSNATVTLQFNASDPKGALFDPAQPTMYIGRFPTGGPWVASLATKGGSDPYTVSATFTAFSPFAVTTDASALPIQLSSFTGTVVNSRVKLNWTTASEVNNYGFYVQKRAVGVLEWSSVENSFVVGHGTTNVPQQYTFTDNAAFTSALQYRLKQVDLDGSIHFTDPIQVDAPTSVREVAPIAFALNQNYPNPFNPETNIRFSVEQTGRATLDLYNMLGQKVLTLFDGEVEAGYYNTVRLDGSNLASGVYLYRLQSKTNSDLKKLVLMK